MHELAICQNIVAAAQVEYDRVSPPPLRLRCLRIVAGGLHQLEADYLCQVYALLTRDTPLAGSQLELKILPVTVRCQHCAWNGQIELPIFQCRSCGSYDVDVTQGKELRLDLLELELP